MPLPANSTLSLLGAPHVVSSKPKKAMLVRMSADTLDALEALPQLQFEFGENPGVYIGQAYFPMAHLQENSNHELYLRAASVTKKNAPLKLYANVVGKFSIEQREIGDELRDKIRESTHDAVAQKGTRGTVFMETPPETQAVNTAKKRKDTPANAMFRKPLRPSDKVKPLTAASTGGSTPLPPSKAPTASSSSSAQGGVPLRKRFVHCLARGNKSEDDLFKLLGAPDRNSSLRSEISELMDQLAEIRSATEKSPKLYQLKSAAWKEVRPFDWPGLSEQERIKMARIGRQTLQNLRVPATDPLWNHFQYKSSVTDAVASNSQPSTSSNTPRPLTSSIPSTEDRQRLHVQDAPKRGVSSRDIKEKKMKPKADYRVEIQMKDESQRSTARPPPESEGDNRKSGDSRRESATLQQPARRPASPARRAQDNSGTEKSSAPRRQDKESTHPKSSSAPSDQLKKRNRDRDYHASDSERGTERVRVKDRQPRKGADQANSATSQSKSSRQRDLDDADYGDQTRIRDIEEPSIKKKIKEESDFVDAKALSKRRSVEDNDRVERTSSQRPADNYRDSRSTSSKRRRDDAEYVDSRPVISKRRATEPHEARYDSASAKRRKIDRDSISSSTPLPKDGREAAMPRKSNTDARQDGSKNRPTQSSTSSKNRNVSPLPPARGSAFTNGHESHEPHSSSRTDSSTTKSSKSSAATKLRRKSPVYTSSSEDEKDGSTPLSQRMASKGSADPPTNAQNARNLSSRSVPSSHGDLRARYNATYLEYLGIMQKLLMQKGKLDNLLKSGDVDSTGSITDSDGDVDLLAPEELETLTVTHERLRSELQSIQKAYGQPVKVGSLSD